MANEIRETDLFTLVLEVINPAMVMGLIGSLAFFLLDVCYRGNFDDQLRWTLFFFVFAIVLVARISFTMGSDKAAGYGMLLGGVTFLATMRFVKGLAGRDEAEDDGWQDYKLPVAECLGGSVAIERRDRFGRRLPVVKRRTHESPSAAEPC